MGVGVVEGVPVGVGEGVGDGVVVGAGDEFEFELAPTLPQPVRTRRNENRKLNLAQGPMGNSPAYRRWDAGELLDVALGFPQSKEEGSLAENVANAADAREMFIKHPRKRGSDRDPSTLSVGI